MKAIRNLTATGIVLFLLGACSHVKILPGSYKPDAQGKHAAVALYYDFAPPEPTIYSRLYLSLRSVEYKTDEKVEFNHKQGLRGRASKQPLRRCVVLRLAAPEEWSIDFIAFATARKVLVPQMQNPLHFEVQPGKLYWLGTVSEDPERYITHDPGSNKQKCADHVEAEYPGLIGESMEDLPVRRDRIEDVYLFQGF